MKYKALAIVFLIGLSGCLPTYVGAPEKSTLDEHLLGVWYFKNSDEQLLFVHAMDKHSYLVQEFGFERKDGKAVLKGQPLTMRGWITPIAGKQFISLQVFAAQFLIDPTDENAKNRYIVASFSVAEKSLTASGVSADFLISNKVTTPAEFEKALADHGGEPGAFIDPNVYDRIDVKSPGPAGELLDLIKADNQ